MSIENENEFFNRLSDLDGETLLHLFVDYHGMQLLTGGFAEFCDDNGVDMPFIHDGEQDDEGDESEEA